MTRCGWLAALVCAVLSGADLKLPDGVRAVWDVSKAFHESTPTRERISINGLWRWQPAGDSTAAPPPNGWGYLRVPESWPGGNPKDGSGRQVFFPQPDWDKRKLGAVTAAWYQREITLPLEWSDRRITLSGDHINSYAAVFVDGVRAGEIRYPGGEIDLTKLCQPGKMHVLSLLVVAMPLKAVMLSYNDTASARNVEGRVARKGLCGDVYLSGVPAAARITHVKAETSVRKWQITADAALEGLDRSSRYRLSIKVIDGNRQVKSFTSPPFSASDLSDGHIRVVEPWRPEKLWDTITPQNQYDMAVSLLRDGGALLDTALPVRFGFRELWINGRDFYLNGTRIYLSAVPIDNGIADSTQASYDAARATLQRFKSFGINFVYTHNYSCEPGTHFPYEEILRAADDEGVLLSLSQPHFGHYDWTTSNANNGYAQHAAFYARVAGSHPSVVFYSTSHNGTGYSEDMNPDMIDGVQNPRDSWSLRNAERASRAEAIIRQIDGSRITYHHASGNLGPMHTSNFYANWAPIQEMSDWFEHWATKGVKPLFTCEYSVPFLWDWAMYRGWYKGKREFGSAPAPWEFCNAEWTAQFLGDKSYQIGEDEKKNLRWEADQFRKGRIWQRWDYPQSLNSQVFEDRFRVIAMYLTANWRAFRTWGLSANSPWEYGSYWKQRKSDNALDLEVDWDRLQRPGPRPAYVREDLARAQLAFKPSDWEPTAAALAIERNNRPLLAYIAGKPSAFTSNDHNFLPGEAVDKQLIVINNSRRTIAYDCHWTIGLPQVVTGSAAGSLPTGEQVRIPLRIGLPASLASGRYELHAAVKFSTGETQDDSFSIDVMNRPAAAPAGMRVALFDPIGDTAQLLSRIGLHFQRIDANADLSAFDTLIVGKGALSLQGAAPSIARVREGLKVIVFEQTAEVLEKRFGFRVAEYGLRWVFRRVPDHPLLSGLNEEHLRDWRGEATILPQRLAYERPALFNYVPTVKWAGIPVPRVWRAGNRGSVASALIEKPARGNFLPVVDGGYSLQYSPLMEYREGKGLVLFCQMDVSGRTENDPAAETLAGNIVRYASTWKPAPVRSVAYAGDSAGMRYLQKAGISIMAYHGGPSQLLVLGAGTDKLPNATGPVLAVGLNSAEIPARVTATNKEHIAAWFPAPPFGSPFAGVSPAEVHNRDPRKLSLIESGAAVLGDGVLAHTRDAQLIFCQLAPWQFEYTGEKMNIKRTFRRTACLLNQVLSNMGAAGQTPLLDRFSSSVDAKEQRWLDGFYLDVPEEWDDPYRFFRW